MYKDSLFQNCSPVCPNVTIAQAVQRQHICIRFFQFPLTSEAYQQYLVLENSINNIVLSDQSDVWQYIWGSGFYSSNKAYKRLIGHVQLDPVYRWLRGSKWQPKCKLFFLLLLKNRLNTIGLLRRRNMNTHVKIAFGRKKKRCGTISSL